MMAQVYSFDIDKGTDWELACKYKDSDGVPINITGATFDGDIKAGSITGTLIDTFNFAITNGAAGEFKLYFSDTETAAMATGKAYYDVEMTLGGLVYRLFEGEINIRGEVTT